jgi:hypothetical protein
VSVPVVRILHEIEEAVDRPELLHQVGSQRISRCDVGDTSYDSTHNRYPNIGHKIAEADSYYVKRVIR